MTEAEEKQIAEIESNLTNLLAFTPEKLARVDDLGKQLNFSGGEESFRNILTLFSRLKSVDLRELPPGARNNIQGQVKNILGRFNTIMSFSAVGHQNPATVRDQMLGELPSNYENYWNVLMPIITYSAVSTDKTAAQRAEALRSLTQDKEEMARKLEDTKQEMEGLLNAARNAAAQLGITEYSKVFLDQAAEHKEQARNWLWATIIGSIALCVWGLITFSIKPDDGNNFFSVMQNAVSKGIILIGLLYFTITASKNYNAHRHNAILNKHRQNALQTFESFVKAAGDDQQTKNAVLLQATATIFSNQNTGYLAAGPEPEGASKIIEIIKGVAPSKPT